MTPPAAVPLADLGAEIDAIRSLIAAARRLLGDGRSLDLGSLERRVGQLCAALRRSPQAATERTHDPLRTMLADLDLLEDEVRRQLAALARRIDGATASDASSAGAPSAGAPSAGA